MGVLCKKVQGHSVYIYGIVGVLCVNIYSVEQRYSTKAKAMRIPHVFKHIELKHKN